MIEIFENIKKDFDLFISQAEEFITKYKEK